MTSKNDAHTEDERLLIDAFECKFVGHGYPSIFQPQTLHEDNKTAVLALIASGEPLGSALGRYVGLVGVDSEIIKSSKGLGKSCPRYQTVTGSMHCLLGMPEHKQAVLDYILANLEAYTRISKGMFGRNYNQFDRVFVRAPGSPLSNFTRNASGGLLSPEAIDKMVIDEHDTHALLMSTVANKDREGIEQLMKSERFTALMPHSAVISKLADLVRKHPAWGLKPLLGPVLEQKTNAGFMFEMQRLLKQSDSTKEEFRDAFWSGVDPIAISDLVREVVKTPMIDFVSARHCLEVLAESGVDFHLGLLLAREGLGAMLDAKSQKLTPQNRSFYVIESYLEFSEKGARPKYYGALLLNLPVEDIVAHAQSTKLLFERYRLTMDKSLLKAGDKKFNGMVLQNDLGM